MKARYLHKAAAITLCVGVSYFTARAAAHFWAPPVAPFTRPAPAGSAGAREARHSADRDIAVILRRNLLHARVNPPAAMSGMIDSAGNPIAQDRQAALAAAEMEKLPLSKLGGDLLGTVVDTSGDFQSRAIISLEGAQKAYPVGSEIKGWRIIFIDRRTVVLEKASRRERMLVGGRPVEGAPSGTPGGAAVSMTLRRGEVEEQMRDLPGLMRQVGFMPGEAGGMYGLSITRIESGSWFARLGLQKNDLLVQANGQPMTSFGDLASLSGIARQKEFRIKALRNGKPLIMEYRISE